MALIESQHPPTPLRSPAATEVVVAMPLPDLSALVDAAAAYARASKAPRTLSAYRAQFGAFERWCAAHSFESLPASPEVVAMYIASRADEGRKPATIALALAAITAVHKARDLPSPCASARVAQVREGIARRVGIGQTQKVALDVHDLRKMIDTMPPGVLGVRDRALLLAGFAGGFRRSELVGLDVEDVTFVEAGVELQIRQSKTDQRGVGALKVIAKGERAVTCPVTALKAWLDLAGLATGPVFRGVNRHGRVATARLTEHSVALVVKRAAERIGLDASGYSGHSMRAGFVTAANARGATDAAIMAQTSHKTLQMLVRYTRRVHLWDGAASSKLGL